MKHELVVALAGYSPIYNYFKDPDGKKLSSHGLGKINLSASKQKESIETLCNHVIMKMI